MDVKLAQDFIIDRVLQPAVDSPVTSKRIKDQTKNSIQWVRQFKRTGDLIAYMDRFQGEPPPEIKAGLEDAGIETFEGIHDEFIAAFQASKNDRTRLEDFIVGQRYSAYDINIFAQRYDLRSGGILPIGEVGNHIAVFIKATLVGGAYPNEWIEKGQRLRYYLKSLKGNFDERYKDNRSIIKYPSVPVYAFVRETGQGPFEFSGVFNFISVQKEKDDSKWFELVRIDIDKSPAPLTPDEFNKSTSRNIESAQKSSKEQRQRRLGNAPTRPKTTTVIVEAYIRNPDVIAEVLERANGICEGCKNPAPFMRRRDGSPYLEVHHKVPLSLEGEDSVENAIALCPNCHKEEHYGPPKWQIREEDLPEEIE